MKYFRNEIPPNVFLAYPAPRRLLQGPVGVEVPDVGMKLSEINLLSTLKDNLMAKKLILRGLILFYKSLRFFFITP